MDKQTFFQAQGLQYRLDQLNEVRNSFEWIDDNGVSHGSRKPKIIIEYDDEDGGRSQVKAPFDLTPEMIEVLSVWVEKEEAECSSEFASL